MPTTLALTLACFINRRPILLLLENHHPINLFTSALQ